MTEDLPIEGPRGCTRAELPELVELINDIFRSGIDQNVLTDYPLVYREKNLPNLRLVKSRGQIVSKVAFVPWSVDHEGCRFRIGIVSLVGTHPEHRHKGYGLRCMESAITCMNEQDIALSVLWTVVPTFEFYNHVRYQAVSQQGWTYSLSHADAAIFKNHGETIETYDPDSRSHLQDIQGLRESHTPGIQRDHSQTAALLALGRQKTIVARCDNRVTAYLTVSLSANKPGIIEAVGDAKSIETLVHHALSTTSEDDMRTMKTFVHRYADPLGDLLNRKLVERPETSKEDQMMMRINNVSGFFGAIQPWLKRQNGSRVRSFSLGVDSEIISLDFTPEDLSLGSERRDLHLELSHLDLTSTIFGAHHERPFEAPEELTDLFPFRFPISVLERS
jgi:GNAT superfamily N-acetyltransferase